MIVDADGQKMSKSRGNGVMPQDIIEKYGADILRLWVTSADYKTDMRISEDILKQLSEAYRKIRNTARYILGNLCNGEGFNPDTDCVAVNELHEIDKWALMRLDELTNECKTAYDNFEFHIVFHAIHNFCVLDMSNFYLDVLKDRLYVEKADSVSRRAAQTTIYNILTAMTKLVAPILSFTAEEIWDYIPKVDGMDQRSVLLNDITENSGRVYSDEFKAKWEKLHAIRDDVNKALESARNEKVIGKSLEAEVVLKCDGELYEFVSSNSSALPEICIVSAVKVVNESATSVDGAQIEGLGIEVKKASGDKCERCWMYSETVGENSVHPTLCRRCAEILK
jgi:isoleucyl-tRNA synthetase